jgi:hypothetical protein
VRDFYDWYVPRARTGTLNSEDAALNARRDAFSPQLLKYLAELDGEQKRNRDAGLDFDWILNSQDPGDPGDSDYLVRSAKMEGHFCRVNVSRQPDGKSERISPKLRFGSGRWLFVNFHYPNAPRTQSENLLA